MRNYEKTYNSLYAMGGQTTCWSLPFFCEGMIQKVIIKQVGGTPTSFTIDIFNSLRACEGLSSQSSEDNQNPVVDQECYRVFATINGSEGETITLIETSGRSFRNMDGNWTVPVRRIYLQVTPQGNSECAFDVCLGGWTDVG
jgi:hypothetical protein